MKKIKCTFYRPEKINIQEFSNIVSKLEYDLNIACNEELSENSLYYYAASLLRQAEPLENNPEMYFLGLDNPGRMPGDARDDFFYRPTYLGTAMVIRTILLYPELFMEKNGSYVFGRENSVKDAGKILRGLLLGCTGRSFNGHGYDGLRGMIDTLHIFAQAGADDFIAKYPDICKEFSGLYEGAVRSLEEKLAAGTVCSGWGEDYSDEAKEVLAIRQEKKSIKYRDSGVEEKETIFVYGTLMKGERAENLLAGSEFLGNYFLKDYAMYDLGSYPGIVEQKGQGVAGEAYLVPAERMEAIDSYEGEGSLYHRRIVPVSNHEKTIFAKVYVYAGKPTGRPIGLKWNAERNNDRCWYAAYGSSLCRERFDCYIYGGECRDNHRSYSGCSDHTKWIFGGVRKFPGRVYFGNRSGSWFGKGVSFYDPEMEGEAVMRLYGINTKQLMEVRDQEGPSDNWYGRICCLGIHEDGKPIYTLTSANRRDRNKPSEEYIGIIRRALVEECGFSEVYADQYLADCVE